MAVSVSKFLPTGDYLPEVPKTATNLTFTDSTPLYNYDGTKWTYVMFFYLWSASSSGTNLGEIGRFSKVFTVDPGTGLAFFSGTLEVTIPAGISTGTYYIGATTTGTRKAIDRVRL